MNHPHEEKRRDLHKFARHSFDQPKALKRYAEQMIIQIDSRRLEFPFVDQIERTEKRFAHRMAGGLFPDVPPDQIAADLALHRFNDRCGFEALSEDGRLLELYPSAIVTEGKDQ